MADLHDSNKLASGPIIEKRLSSWTEFDRYIRTISLESSPLLYRGQNRDEPLKSAFDRMLKSSTSNEDRQKLLDEHLENFKRAVAGRSGTHPKQTAEDDEWWALGRHWGLDTPLLDWTESPFIALFFAFEKENDEVVASQRVVYGLSAKTINFVSLFGQAHDEVISDMQRDFREMASDDDYPSELRSDAGQLAENFETIKGSLYRNGFTAIQPMSDENYRQINQRAWFVKCKDGLSLEEWIEKWLPHVDDPVLFKILIPNDGRDDCLRWLDSVNINHCSLFPDLYGATSYCNLARRVPKYTQAGLMSIKNKPLDAIKVLAREKLAETLKQIHSSAQQTGPDENPPPPKSTSS